MTIFIIGLLIAIIISPSLLYYFVYVMFAPFKNNERFTQIED